MNGFTVLARLVIAHNFRRHVRAGLSLAGIAVSVCLVIWIIRGYEAVTSPRAATAIKTGRYDVVVTPPMPRMMPGQRGVRSSGQRPSLSAPQALGIDAHLLDSLRQDGAVASMSARIQSRIRVVDPQPVEQMGPFGGGSMVGLDDPEAPTLLAQGRWLTTNDAPEAVVSSGFLKRYNVAVDQKITVGGMGTEVDLTVVGVVSNSGAAQGAGPFSAGDLYVSLATAGAINGYTGRVNAVYLALNEPETADAFVQAWTGRVAAAGTAVSIRSLHQKDDDPMAGRMVGMIKMQANNAVVLAFLAACFIVFTTLNTGVRERLREYAALRAIAMSRTQLVVSIFAEAIVFAIVGWGLGILLARALLSVGTALAVHLKFFQAGAFTSFPLGKLSLIVAGASAITGSLLAAVIPAWQASRLKPVDILGGQDRLVVRRFPWILVGIGLLLVVANPLMVLAANKEPFKTFFSKTFSMGFAPPLLGSIAMIIGLAMVTPLLIRLVEEALGPALAAVLGLDRKLLRQQLTANLWRNVATTIALSAGLTLFVTALVWGYSMLVPFTPDRSLPRMLVSILPAGIPESAVGEIEKVPGVLPGQCLPLAVEQPRLTDTMLQSKAFESVDDAQQHLLFMGVDSQRAFLGDQAILKLTFVQGDAVSAVAKLRSGRFCLVPDHFKTQTGLGVGDCFSVSIPESPGRSVDYEIAGVVYVPGWHWFTKFAEIRRRSGRALAVVFADYSQVKNDFAMDRVSFLWMNADPAVGYQDMERRLSEVANRHAGIVAALPGVGETHVSRQYVKITEREDLVGKLNRRANDVIWSLTQFPLLVLVIASLAVFNAVFASVHARFWQYGVLRGVGMTRGQLGRLVLSESLMIFLAAGSLSLASGILLAWCGTRICTYFFFFGGMTPPLVLPWAGLSLGFGIAFGLCLLAGVVPALMMASKEPLGFIQAGRTSQ